MNYLEKLLGYALMTLQKLSAPANDDKMKASYLNLLKELSLVSQSEDNTNSSFAIAVIKGLRFILKEIQVCSFCCSLFFYINVNKLILFIIFFCSLV